MYSEQYSPIFNEFHYQNPLIMGDYADPSILKDGEDYYLVNSVCGEKYRLMPMWHSKDLINWELLYHVFEGCYFEKHDSYMLTAWAPELIKHKNLYYIYNYSPSFGIWVSTCSDIKKGDWSTPVQIENVDGIDPGHVTDKDGNRFLCLSRNILHPLSSDGLSVNGEGIKICEDYVIPDEIDIEGVCTESPKYFKKGDYYYFLTAEGGTMGPPTSHCVVAYRTKDPMGEYELSPYNPIVHTDSRENLWWSTGHGSLVNGPDDETYILYHGIRNAHRYMGRQTVMMPIKWTDDDWFTVGKGDELPQNLPNCDMFPVSAQTISVNPKNGNFPLLYNFDSEKVFNRLKFKDDLIEFKAQKDSEFQNESLVFMPQGYAFEFIAEIDLENTTANFAIGFKFTPSVNCGIALLDSEIKLFKHGEYDWVNDDKIPVVGKTLCLKMCCNHGTVSLFYKNDYSDFMKIPHSYDIADWNPNVTKGFSSVTPSIWSYGIGSVFIKSFIYNNL